MLKRFLPLALLLAFGSAVVADEADIRKGMEAKLGAKVESVSKSGYLGLYEVYAEGSIFYTDEKMTAIVVGGQLIGGVGGGLAALRGLKVVSLIRGTAIALTAAGALGALIRFAVRGVQFAYNFNWNITDSQIRQQQKSLIDGLYGQFGETAGTALASILCGYAPVQIAQRSNIVKVNPVALARIKEISEFDPQSDNQNEYVDLFCS